MTKQPQNALKFNPYPGNVWFGVTVNQQSDVWRLDELRKIQAKVKFASFEPLYSRIEHNSIKLLDWVVIGAQTRPELQPEPDWVWNIVFEASSHNIPIFIKNNLRHYNPIQKFPKG